MHIWIVQHQLLRDKGVSPPVVVALFVQSPSPNSNYVALPSCVVVAVLLFCFKAAAAATTLPSHCCSNYVECSRATLYSVTSSGVSLHMLIITTGEIFMQLQSRLDLVIPSNFAKQSKYATSNSVYYEIDHASSSQQAACKASYLYHDFSTINSSFPLMRYLHALHVTIIRRRWISNDVNYS